MAKHHSWWFFGKARKEYDCVKCCLSIYPGELYHREALALNGRVIVTRYHDICPHDRDREWIEREMHQQDEEESVLQDGKEETIPQAA